MKEYKVLLEEAKRLQKGSGTACYDLVMILAKVSNDKEFREDFPVREKAEEFLSGFCSNYALDFPRLRNLVKMFPVREYWEKHSLSAMYRQFEQHHEQAEKRRRATARTRTKERAAKESATKESSAKGAPNNAKTTSEPEPPISSTRRDPATNPSVVIAQLREKLAASEATIARLRSENRQLREENRSLLRRLNSTTASGMRA